jgi:hypothetical protein
MEKLVSSFGFNFNLRRYIKAHELVTLYPSTNELSLCTNRVKVRGL